MRMDDQNRRGYMGEEDFYHSEKIKPILPIWRRYLWQITSLVALVIAFVALGWTALLHNGSHPYPVVTPPSVATPPSAVTPPPTVKTDGVWQGQFSYYPGEPYSTPFEATLQIPAHQGDAFTGTMAEPFYENSIVSVSGMEGGSSLFDQSQLQYVTQLYGNGTGTFVAFTDPAYVQGNQIELNCSYIAVVYADGSLHGVWFYPGHTQPDGTFTLNKVS